MIPWAYGAVMAMITMRLVQGALKSEESEYANGVAMAHPTG